MRVIDVSRGPIAAGWGRCRAVRLLHFSAAPVAGWLTLKRQVGLPGQVSNAGSISRDRLQKWPGTCRQTGRSECSRLALWEASAVAWLLDLVPEFRQYGAVYRHPVILASIARHLIRGSVAGARDGYRTVRTELAEHAPPHAADATLEAYRAEGFRLAAAERAVEFVERALRG